MTVGSVAYAAPEQLTGRPLDGRADQYALAATAYHLLTGAVPFGNSNPAVVIGNHLSSPPPSLSQGCARTSDGWIRRWRRRWPRSRTSDSRPAVSSRPPSLGALRLRRRRRRRPNDATQLAPYAPRRTRLAPGRETSVTPTPPERVALRTPPGTHRSRCRRRAARRRPGRVPRRKTGAVA